MKRKTLAIIAGGLGALGFLALAEQGRRRQRADKKRSALLQEIRQDLSHQGPISVLYVNPSDQDVPHFSGGVVMEDGRIFSFADVDGELIYKEEEA